MTLRTLSSFASIVRDCLILPIIALVATKGAAAQTQSPTLTSVSCAYGFSGFLTASGTINIFDGPTRIGGATLTSPNLGFTYPTPSGMNDSKFHVISVNI